MAPDIEAIEQDLRRLAHVRGGFDHPERISSDMDVLLELDSVAAASAEAESRIERTGGLRRVLRRAVAGIENERTRLAASLYLFLADEGDLAARGKDDSLWSAGIVVRRQVIEDLAGYKPGTFRNGEEERIRGIVAGELAWLDATESGAAQATDGLGGDADLRDLLAAGYGPQHPVDGLCHLVWPSSEVTYDALLSLSLTDDEDSDDLYRYEMVATFSADISSYVVCYVPEPFLTDRVLSVCPGVTEVFSTSGSDERDAAHARMSESINGVSQIVSLPNGQTRLVPIRLHDATDERRDELLYELEPDSREEIRVMEADVPGDAGTLRRLVTRHSFKLAKSDHYCYWYTDRPFYLRQLRVDVSDFTPPPANRNRPITLQRFSLASGSPVRLDDRGVVVLDNENWLVRGQGFIVVW